MTVTVFEPEICKAFEGEKSGKEVLIKAQHAIPKKGFEIQIQRIFMTNAQHCWQH
jgi:hypothetical protein